MTNNELRAWCEAEIEKCTKYGFSPEHEGKALALREVLTRIETNSRTGDEAGACPKCSRGRLLPKLRCSECATVFPQSITPPEVGGELVERVARAICRAWYYCDLDKPDGINHWNANKARCTKEAEAAIATLSTPEVVDGTAGLVEALRPFAEQKTIDEIMQGQEPDEWAGASVERRIELIGERKQKNTENILRARTDLSQPRPRNT